MLSIKKIVQGFSLVFALCVSGSSMATVVGLELVLLTDVSGSVNSTEYNLQKQGYINAFSSVAVQNAILGSTAGGIAVTYVEWSSSSQFSQKVGWTLVNDAASAVSFASALNGVTRTFSNSTAIQSAIYNARSLFGTETGFASNGFESGRQVIDVSGDGTRNQGLGGTTGRDAALLAGVDTINGITIGNASNLTNYYANNVIGGTNAFVSHATSFSDFGAAIQAKLVREITPVNVSEPGSVALLGLGLLGLAAGRRRRG